MQGKESWDCGRKAAELKISDFGTPDEVRKMVKPIRTANSRKEALVLLKEIRRKGALENENYALTATISGDSIFQKIILAFDLQKNIRIYSVACGG